MASIWGATFRSDSSVTGWTEWGESVGVAAAAGSIAFGARAKGRLSKKELAPNGDAGGATSMEAGLTDNGRLLGNSSFLRQ